jgi:hypothetical protein
MFRVSALVFVPLLAVVAFAVMPVAAQAEEGHWYKNGVISPEGQASPIVSWGGATNVVQTSAIGEINCRTVSGGTIENPKGGGRGGGHLSGGTFFECKSPGCEKAAAETGLPLTVIVYGSFWPWHIWIIIWGGGPFLEMGTPFTAFGEHSSGEMVENASCETPPGFEPHVVGASATFEGELDPKIKNGTTASKPSQLTFEGAKSGALHSEIGGEGTLSGSIKFEGYNGQELITAGT